RIHVAMEETRNVIAIINADELAAERIAIAVLNQNKLAGKAAVCIEIHGDVFAVKRKPAECYSLRVCSLAHLNGGGIANDFCWVDQFLFRIPELNAFDPRCRFHCNENLRAVPDFEHAPYGRLSFRMPGSPWRGAVHSNQ